MLSNRSMRGWLVSKLNVRMVCTWDSWLVRMNCMFEVVEERLGNEKKKKKGG